jgi:hypothetical protein
MDPDPAIFAIDLQEANKKLTLRKKFICLLRIKGKVQSYLKVGSIYSLQCWSGEDSVGEDGVDAGGPRLHQSEKSQMQRRLSIPTLPSHCRLKTRLLFCCQTDGATGVGHVVHQNRNPILQVYKML